MVFLQSFANGATLPYVSLIAITQLGLSEQLYALMVVVTATIAVATSVVLGVLADIINGRRRVIILTAAAGVVGYGTIFLFPNALVFVVVSALVIPFFQSASLLFASVRQAASHLPNTDAAAINTTFRTFMSASWVIAPFFVGGVMAWRGSLLDAWGIAALASASVVLTGLVWLPQSAAPETGNAKPGFLRSVRQLLAPDVVVQVVCISSLTAAIRLYAITLPLLVVLGRHGGAAEVGAITSLTALLEIPFMLLWSATLGRFTVLQAISTATCIYAATMILLGFASETWHYFALVIPSAAGAAALLSMPVSYFQDLFPDRPGLGTALNPINSFFANGVTAGTFAISTAVFGYAGALWVGAALALCGVAGLWHFERRRRSGIAVAGANS